MGDRSHAQSRAGSDRSLRRADEGGPRWNRVPELALTRLVEIVGEAATRIPEQERLRFPAVPRRPITGMRNRLIHGYDAVDRDVLWDVVQFDLPELLRALDQ